MRIKSIEVGVRSEATHSMYMSTISVTWIDEANNAKSIRLTRDEALETAARILAMVSLMDPMDTSTLDEMISRVDAG